MAQRRRLPPPKSLRELAELPVVGVQGKALIMTRAESDEASRQESAEAQKILNRGKKWLLLGTRKSIDKMHVHRQQDVVLCHLIFLT